MYSAYGTLTTGTRNPVTGIIALGSSAGVVVLYDLDRGIKDARTLPELRGHAINTITWSPNGIFVASAHQQGFMGAWHAASGRNVLMGSVDKKDCSALVWSRGGAFLVVLCSGRQELIVLPVSEITLERLVESGQVIQPSTIDPIFKWKGKGHLALGNFSPDDLHFAFTGGNAMIEVANTAEWKIEREMKVPVRPSFLHWTTNDRIFLVGPPDKGAKNGEEILALVEFPSGNVLMQQPFSPIKLLRSAPQDSLVFLLEDRGENRSGFHVMDLASFEALGEIAPDAPDICDLVFLPSQGKVGIITKTRLILGDWNGREGSNYKQLFNL